MSYLKRQNEKHFRLIALQINNILLFGEKRHSDSEWYTWKLKFTRCNLFSGEIYS